MRLNLKLPFTAICFIISCISYGQQITVDNSFSAQQLVENNLVQGCVQVTDINSTVNGSINGFSSFGYFERGNSNFPFENGIMLSTGNADSAGNSQNTEPLNEGNPTWGTDPDLEAALGINNTLNATSIEFNFTSASNTVQFNYILASEEYSREYPCLYSDGFAFLIREAGSGAPYQNIAIVPGTTTPVNTSTIHDAIVGFCPAENNQYFEGYNLGDTNFNGRTTVLSASANLIPNTQYNIKLIVADQTDRNFDTAVFIEGNSFTDNVNLGEKITTCDATILLNANTGNPQASYVWSRDGQIIIGQNTSTLTVTTNGTYDVEVTVPLNSDICTFGDTIDVELNTIQNGPPITNMELCDDASNDGEETFILTEKTAEIEATLPAGTYETTFHLTQTEAENSTNNITSILSNTPNQNIAYRSENQSGCAYIGSFDVVINPFLTINQPTDLRFCNTRPPILNLSENNDLITNSNSNYTVDYYSNLTDAEATENQITRPFRPTSNNQTVYINITDITTGCQTSTTLNIITTPTPVINTDLRYLDACEQDGDGFEVFDLTLEIEDVLDGLDPTSVTITYHEDIEAAELDQNPIETPNSFTNNTIYNQIIYIRVEDNITGCASIAPLEIHVFVLDTGTERSDYYECDDASNDGIADFDLADVAIQVINDIPNVTVQFYETETDQLAANNAIDQNRPYTVNDSPKTLYLILENLECEYNSEITLVINDGFAIQPLTTQNYCDTDSDGFTRINLSSFNDYVSTDILDPIVSYHATSEDAETGSNALPNNYLNPVNPLTIYANVISRETGCNATSPLTIEVLPAPITTTPDDVLICDNDQDGFSIINLETLNNTIVTDTTQRSFTYYTSQENAEDDTNPITDASTYNTNTQELFCRIVNTETGCFSIEPITIYVNTLPVFTPIDTLISCESDGNQIGEFLFAEKDAEILNGQTGKEVLYFTSQNNADTGINPIDKTSVFENSSDPQTIYTRVQNTTDNNCFDTSTFQIEVGSYPIYTPPTSVFVCDDNTNDGFETFDLTEIANQIRTGSTETLNISFHLNEQDAETQTNPLPDNFTTTDNPQQIFATIDNGTFCKGIESFEFNVIAVPETNMPNPITLCDNDTDGFINFDLTSTEIDILSIRQDNIVVQYYTSSDDLEQNTNQITNPSSYRNISNPQTVFIKVLNTVSQCYAELPLDLLVDTPPSIRRNRTIDICENDTLTYNLNQVLPRLIDIRLTIETAFYSTLEDAEQQQNQLDTNYAFVTGNQTLYLRANQQGSICYNIVPFVLNANPRPTIGALLDLETCNNDYDTSALFNLEDQNITVLDGQEPNGFTINYFTSLGNALNNTNSISDLNIESENNTTYYVRIQNNDTGCFTTSSFNTIVLRKPVIDIDDQALCIDNLPLTVTAETNISTDTYLWSTGSTDSFIEINQTGNYTVTVTSEFGCYTIKSFNISESESATIEFTETIDFSDPNNVTVEISGIGDYQYQLDDNEPQESNVLTNVPLGPHTITVIDLNGCNSTSKEVVIIDAPKFFTPNRDGYFDTWHITGVNQLTGTVISIYDRYGKLLKILDHGSAGWDGTYNGNLMPSNDYWYIADVKKGNISFQVKGHFSLQI